MNVSRAAPSSASQRSYNGHYMTAGKKAEEIVLRWLIERPNVVDLDDLRSLRPLQKVDVDSAIYTTDGHVAFLEIKSDWHLGVSGNVLVELARINHTAVPNKSLVLGWSVRSPAEWLAMYAPQRNEIWITRFASYRRAFQTYTWNAREATRLRWVNTDDIKSTLNAILPESAFSSCFHKFALEEGF